MWIGTFSRGLLLAPKPPSGILGEGGSFADLGRETILTVREQSLVFPGISTTNGLSSERVFVLLEDSAGVVWVGTDRGLNRVTMTVTNNQPRFSATYCTTREGLPSNVITSLVEDELDQLWIGCDKGIYQVAKSALNALAAGSTRPLECRLLETSTELLGTVCNGDSSKPTAVKTRDGRLLFATTKGLLSINPSAVARVADLHPPILERVLVDDVERHYPNSLSAGSDGKELTLGVRQIEAGSGRRIEFQVTCANFERGAETRFAYRLTGAKAEPWTEPTSRRFIHYSNLPPGLYTFWAKSTGRGGSWGKQTPLFAFGIEAFYWQTVPFKAATILLSGAAFWGVSRREVRRLRRLRELEAVNHRLTVDRALDGQRRQFSRNLHDEIGSDLMSIKSRIRDPHCSTLIERTLIPLSACAI